MSTILGYLVVLHTVQVVQCSAVLIIERVVRGFESKKLDEKENFKILVNQKTNVFDTN